MSGWTTMLYISWPDKNAVYVERPHVSPAPDEDQKHPGLWICSTTDLTNLNKTFDPHSILPFNCWAPSPVLPLSVRTQPMTCPTVIPTKQYIIGASSTNPCWKCHYPKWNTLKCWIFSMNVPPPKLRHQIFRETGYVWRRLDVPSSSALNGGTYIPDVFLGDWDLGMWHGDGGGHCDAILRLPVPQVHKITARKIPCLFCFLSRREGGRGCGVLHCWVILSFLLAFWTNLFKPILFSPPP